MVIVHKCAIVREDWAHPSSIKQAQSQGHKNEWEKASKPTLELAGLPGKAAPWGNAAEAEAQWWTSAQSTSHPYTNRFTTGINHLSPSLQLQEIFLKNLSESCQPPRAESITLQDRTCFHKYRIWFSDLKLYFSHSACWVSSQTEALKTPEVLLDGRNAHSQQRGETHYERSHFSDITWHSGFFILGEIMGYAAT